MQIHIVRESQLDHKAIFFRCTLRCSCQEREEAKNVEFYRLLGGGQRDAGLDGSGRSINQLAILPVVTHYTIDTSSGLVPTAVSFLDAPMAAAQ